MSARIQLVQGDTGPQIKVTISDETTGNPVDLAGATATLHFRAADTTTVLFSRLMYIDPQTAADGVAIHQWLEGDLDREAGSYEGEVEVVFSTGMRQTVYRLLKFTLREQVG